jgi:thiol-disulfide isomerase/thioredoxin
VTRLRFAVALGALLLHVATLGAQVPTRTPDDAPRADLRWFMQPLQGMTQTLEPFRGRVMVVNAWATWCEPCVAELRSFAALRVLVPDTSLVFVLVAAQRREPVVEFVRRRRLTLPVYLEARPAPAGYRFDAVPTTWIIDRAGRIVWRHRGAMRWDTEAVRRLLTALLAAPAPDFE